MLRVFFGLELPAEQRSSLAVQQFLLPLPQRSDPADFHLTLAFLGALPDAEVQAAHEAAETLQAAPFDLTISDLGLFGAERPRVVWAGVRPCPDLMRLQAKLDHALRRSGLQPDSRRFAPHVTLGRFTPPPLPEALRLERAVAETHFALPPFRVESLALFRVQEGRKSGRFQVLMRYPWRGGLVVGK